ncbi:MAG: DNA repair protein RecN [Simkaniaceae bacterium]|nr:DNA repair protein RecN [Simkaniaceae bacterium]
MLKYLKLTNMILIDHSEIEFQKGLNILSGETGAGKTILLQALDLVFGKKTDTSVIRSEKDRAIIEAAFEIQSLPKLHAILESSGILVNPEEYLIIKREIPKIGNTRTFINSQMVTLAFLEQIKTHLFEIASQNYGIRLRSNDFQREILDTYAKLEMDVQEYKNLSEQNTKRQTELSELQEEKNQSSLEIDRLSMQYQEICDADIKDSEDDELFSEYSKLANSQEISGKIEEIQKTISSQVDALVYAQKALEKLLLKDEALIEPFQLINSSSVNISEATFFLSQYLDNISYDPKRLDFLEKRLSLIDKFKKKYGGEISSVKTFQLELANKLSSFALIDQKIEDAELKYREAKSLWEHSSSSLSKKRKSAANLFEKALTKELQELNMKGALLSILIKKVSPTSTGEDFISFDLSANIGEQSIPVKDKSSGGEISRIMLAIKTLLAEKEQTPTILFDEIDANIGGETASFVGEKLEKISQTRQVICITHFPQVASKASYHLKIHKQEKQGRTETFITPLNEISRQKELVRMLGGTLDHVLNYDK